MKPEISVVMPCLNEEETVGKCIDEINKFFEKEKINGEIIVCDNGSKDSSVKIANSKKARVIKQNIKGYGAACIKGILSAKGNIIVIGDSDGTYDFSEIPILIVPIKDGYEFIVGNRFNGKMKKGSMTYLHFVGNAFLSGLIRILFKSKIYDAHCGLRAFTKDAFKKMSLKSDGMEFASEMVIKAAKKKIKTCEVKVSYRKRKGKSKLNSLRDGWRHLVFILSSRLF
ncbi:MAG: glycosyltransferase family 2 protein [Candidatus Nanoarchaeia archaeon]|nr:glycosyltransferase family 2 protein [Candidatus Nanoarchaeia archaeon]